MNYKKLIFILKNRSVLICTITLISMILCSFFTFFIIKPKYESKISLIIGNNNSEITGQNYDKFVLNKNLVETYGTFSQTNLIAEDVIKTLNLDMSNNELISMIDYEIDPLTQFLTLTVKSHDQAESAVITNQIAKSLKKLTAIITKKDMVYIVDYASIPASPYNINIILNFAISLVLGLVLSFMSIFLLEITNNKIKLKCDLEDLMGLSLLAIIPIQK